MALICMKCYADVTEAYHSAVVRKHFRCKACKGNYFRHQADEPKVPYLVTRNDEVLCLKPRGILNDEQNDK